MTFRVALGYLSHQVTATLISGMTEARNLVVNLTKTKKSAGFKDTVNLVKSSYKTLLSLDRTFYIEYEMLQNGQEIMDVGMSKRIFDCLPTQDTEVTLETSRTKLTSLMQGADFGMVSGVSRLNAEFLEEILGNMSRSISPSASLAAGGDFHKELLLRLSYFVRCKSRDGTTLTGRAALDFMWEKQVKIMNSATKKTFEDD